MKWIVLEYPTVCSDCLNHLNPGEEVLYIGNGTVYCGFCGREFEALYFPGEVRNAG